MFMISPKVHRALSQTAIKDFILGKRISMEEVVEKYSIDLKKDMPYSHLLDELIDEYISKEDTVKFLFSELNYGRTKNIYINQINDVSLLKDESQLIKCINNLKGLGIKDADLVNCELYKGDFTGGIPLGETKLLYSEIIKAGTEVERISLLIADCLRTTSLSESNNYYPIDIDVKEKLLVIRIRNWTSANSNNLNIDKMYSDIENKIAKAFSLELKDMSLVAQETAYSLLSSLIDVILKDPMDEVCTQIGTSINTQVLQWARQVLPKSANKLTKEDYDVLKQQIINSYCKHYIMNECEEIKAGEIHAKYGVDGYPRNIRFIDDTVSEGHARSQDTKESLLQTSIFYDVKARLDQAKNIKFMTVYWLTCEFNDMFGISIYTNSQKRFRIIFLPRHYNKEMYEYVLQQIKKYMPA